jgi:hypothetical protein
MESINIEPILWPEDDTVDDDRWTLSLVRLLSVTGRLITGAVSI